jgi:serine/threonine protein phosphatase PrpC
MKRYAALPKTGNKSREDVTGVELLRNALNSAFRELDSALRKLQSELNQQYLSKEEELQGEQAKDSEDNVSTFRKLERSGSTCCVVVITPSHFICANAGDSRAILRRGGNTLPLSFDHKPPNLPEQERIVSAGGFVKARRVDGDLAVSRGLGDFFFKSQIELPLNKQKVISEPEILVYPRDSVKDEFIAVACDGVWDVVDNNECGAMIQDILDEGETDIVLVCEEVLDSCLEKNSRDNMTLVMVCLPAIRMMKDSGRRSNVVMNRRAARRNRILEAHAKAAAQTTAKTIGLNFNYKGSNQLAQASSEHTSLRLEEKQPQRSD